MGSLVEFVHEDVLAVPELAIVSLEVVDFVGRVVVDEGPWCVARSYDGQFFVPHFQGVQVDGSEI